MHIGNVLLHSSAENTDPARGATAWALSLAAHFQARLTALVYPLDVVVGADRGTGDGSSKSLTTGEGEPAEQLRKAAERMNLDAVVVSERSFAYGIPEVVAGHVRLNDLIIAGVSHSGLLSERSIAEHLLFEAGRPIVIVPDDHASAFRCEKITIAWDWSRAAARAVGDAIPLLRTADEVQVVSFADEKQFDTSLDRSDLVGALEKRGVNANFKLAELQGRPIGRALCEEALDHGSDLLVMGGYGHSRLRQFILGGATRSILDGPGLPTLLSH